MKKLLVLFITISFVGVFAATAIAAEWNFYGHARLATYYISDSEEQVPPDGDDDVQWELQSNSRIGAKVKAGDINGRFDYGTGINLRLLYGEWDFGSGSMLVGQDYTPIDLLYSNQVGTALLGGDDDLLATGSCYEGRHPQLKFKFGDFQFALVKPYANTSRSGKLLGFDMGFEKKDDDIVDIVVPKFEASYNFKTDTFFVYPFAAFQTYQIDRGGDNEDYDVDAWVAGVGAGLNMNQFYIKTSVHYSANPKNLGLLVAARDGYAYTNDGDLEDSENLGTQFIAGFMPADNLMFEAGVGYTYNERDDDAYEKDDVMALYANCRITLAPGVMITPEIGYIDFMDKNAEEADADGDYKSVDEGDTFYIGAKWEIRF
jgi:hypothetical protein